MITLLTPPPPRLPPYPTATPPAPLRGGAFWPASQSVSWRPLPRPLCPPPPPGGWHARRSRRETFVFVGRRAGGHSARVRCRGAVVFASRRRRRHGGGLRGTLEPGGWPAGRLRSWQKYRETWGVSNSDATLKTCQSGWLLVSGYLNAPCNIIFINLTFLLI